ncbi:ATP-dependent helicase [Microbacterium sp. YY-01]|uniref:ATP-dependent helicase n=1 Tax=Microbacterium sp. YY-01 TaxID=3421634 RepID=UPI003D185FD8
MSALDALDDQQREAASTLRGPVVVLAGAGTGKTRVITHRIAHGVEVGAYTPSRVMAVTFTAKAAGEMRGRLRQLGVDGVAARTFHSAALSQLNYFWPTVAGSSAPGLIDNKVRLLAHAVHDRGLRWDTATLRDVASVIEWRKVSMLSIDDAVERHPGVTNVDKTQLADALRAYEALKDERRRLDFEDVLLACAGMLEAEPRVAAAVHEQYRHFTVDEYQDVSPLQNRLLELWLGNRRDLCVVGDPAQTIYSFTGADQRYLLEFTHRYTDATTVRLETNYRSTEQVLAVANSLMKTQHGALQLSAARATPTADVPTLTRYRTDEEESSGVARDIATRLAAGVPASDIAVLYRSHAQSAAVISALAQHGVSATVLGGRKFFDIPEVRQAIVALRGAAVAPSGREFIVDVRDVLHSLGFREDPPEASGAVREVWEARRALLQLAEEAPPTTTLREFSDELMARAKSQHEPTLDTVTLSTLHAAKGLEWPHVYIIGCSEGLMPISYATSMRAVDEERRLVYVGITRSERTLKLSWAEQAGARDRRASRFLTEIGTGTLRETAPSATRARRHR